MFVKVVLIVSYRMLPVSSLEDASILLLDVQFLQKRKEIGNSEVTSLHLETSELKTHIWLYLFIGLLFKNRDGVIIVKVEVIFLLL